MSLLSDASLGSSAEYSAAQSGQPPESGGDQDAPGPAEGVSELPKDAVFSLLSSKRRRRVLEYLTEEEAQTTLSDLAEHIAALENDTEVRLLTSQQRKRVYVALFQCHLPKMDDAAVVDFEQSGGTVELGPAADQLLAYLDRSDTTSEDGRAAEQSGGRTRLGEALERWLK